MNRLAFEKAAAAMRAKYARGRSRPVQQRQKVLRPHPGRAKRRDPEAERAAREELRNLEIAVYGPQFPLSCKMLENYAALFEVPLGKGCNW